MTEFTDCKISSVEYDGLKHMSSLIELFSWQREVFKPDNEWNNEPVLDGMIMSPYMTLTANGVKIPVYAARATFSTHSFAYIEVDTVNKTPKISVEMTLNQKRNCVAVLPLSACVHAVIEEDRLVKSTLNAFGNFTFVFDNAVFSAVTLIVYKKDSVSLPKDYAVKEIEPSRHTLEQTDFRDEKTIYRFKKGTHYVDCVNLPSYSVLLLDSGAVIKPYGKTMGSTIRAREVENVIFCGRGAIDFSDLDLGGSTGFDFFAVKNLRVCGITLINSNSWTACFTNCEMLDISELVFVGYRMYSDGIMLSDCRDAFVHNCFIRTGDDAAEVKSTSEGRIKTNNVLFENIAVWSDKACCFGIVYENNHDTTGVTFKNCSVGFALPNWSDHLGCITVCAGNNTSSTDKNVVFDGFEIFYTLCSAITMCAYMGRIEDITVKNVNVKHSFSDAPIYFNVRDPEKASIGKVRFSNITVQNVRLCDDTRDKLIGINAPKGGFLPSDAIIEN